MAAGLPVVIRPAIAPDAPGMSRVRRDIVAWNGGDRPAGREPVLATSIRDPSGLRCSVACDTGGALLGFQSLLRAAAGSPHGTRVDRGIIGTHVGPAAHGRGIGRALFAASLEAASQAGLVHIEAQIGAENAGAIGFCDSPGFRTLRAERAVVRKVFDLPAR